MFGLEALAADKLLSSPGRQSFLSKANLYLANARSGIRLLTECLSPACLWLPSYLCGVVLQGVDRLQTHVRFYEVTGHLTVASDQWLEKVNRGDLIVLVDYFGFPADAALARSAKERGAWILEDACQAMLSKPTGRFADFELYSPRKFLGVPDGGILVINSPADFPKIRLSPPPGRWWLDCFTATLQRREFDRGAADRHWFELFRRCDERSPVGAFAMSELARLLLRHAFDYQAIARRRVENYRRLAKALGDMAVFPSLASGVVPLGFPIRLQKRDRVREALFQEQIYPPVHWAIKGTVPTRFRESHRLAAEIMTLPCDQRYGPADMERMIGCVQEALAGKERRAI